MRHNRNRETAALFAVAVLFLISLTYSTLIAPPHTFPTQHVITVKSGGTIGSTASLLKENGIIQSATVFKAAALLFGGKVIAGDYYLDTRENVLALAWRMNRGEYGLDTITVRIEEGSTVAEMAQQLQSVLPRFDAERFTQIATQFEGYLYPDTYHFLPSTTADEVVSVLRGTFFARIEDIALRLGASGRSVEDIVIMASILEREAHDFEVKRRIASVLWNRLDIDMALQVDATFRYINGKGTYDITKAELADASSPYNTYQHKGLPPTPIGSPSIESIIAAAEPIESNYLYYLADRNGVTYFSRTFEEHKRKKALYVN